MVRGFGDLEAAIMDAVWGAAGPVLVREVREGLNAERPIAYTTVQTVMEILRGKGWLTRAKDGRAFRYQAAASREDYAAGLIDQVFESGADRTATLVKLAGQMDAGEIAALRAALAEVKAGGAR
jgi:predicted transcriptional regulator